MQERDIFSAAVPKNAAERTAYLAEACGDNRELRLRVEQLLVEHEKEQSFFLDAPLPGVKLTIDQPLHEMPGTQIGPYKLLQQIGEGGMGVVYMAEQTEPILRRVALKIIKPGMDTRQVIARFESERQALALMDHVNIARVLDAGATEHGRPYFAMELVHGVPITKYCDDNRLTPRQRLELFVPVCQAIQHAHQKGIIHRDIKPSNVMVTLYDGKPVPKVIDFGVAKATEQKLTERTLFTQYGTMVGTLEYMSPEQAELSALGVDTRSDIYSLGVLLYELLTGSTPLSHQRVKDAAYAEILRLIREEEPPKPSTRLSDSGEALASISAQRHTESAKLSKLMRGELDWIVMKTLEKDRSRRYETANGFAADVQRYLADEPVLACPPSATYRFSKFARRNKAPLLTLGLLALSLLLGSVISVWQALRAREAERLADARLVTETEARQRATTESAKAIAISDLLQEALRSASPDHVKGAEYTVRQLLDDLSQRLGGQLNDQPLAKAAIHATIGNTYCALGQNDSGATHLKMALDLRRRLLGLDHPDAVTSLLDHSYNEFGKRNFVAAVAEARQALESLERGNDRTELTLRALSLLALFLQQQERLDEGQVVAERGLNYAKARGYTDHPDLAHILHNLAATRLTAEDFAGAEDLAVKAVAMHRRVNGDHHPETGWALYQLGQASEKREKLAEAETAFREALALFREHYDDSHKSIVLVMERLLRVLVTQGDDAAIAALGAEKLERAVKAVEGKRGDPVSRIALGNALREAGDLEGAAAQFSKIDAKTSELAPEAKRNLAESCTQLAKSLHVKGEREQAERLHRHAIALREPTDEAPPEVRLAQSGSYNDLAFVLKLPDQLSEAEEAIRTALELKQRLVDDFPENASYRFHLAHSWLGLGYIRIEARQLSDAAKAFAKADDTLKALAADATAIATLKEGLGQVQRQLGDSWGRVGQADNEEQAYRAALATFRQLEIQLPKSSLYRHEQGNTHWRIADVLERDGRTEEAESHLVQALAVYEALSKDYPKEAFYRQEQGFTQRKLANLTERAGRFEETERHLSEAAGFYDSLMKDSPDFAFYRQEQSMVQWHRSRLMQRLGRWPEADAALGEVVRLKPDFAEAKNALADADAEVKARQAARNDPGSVHALRTLGEVFRRRGNLPESENAFREALRLKPDDPETHYLSGPTYAELGRWAEAAAAFEHGVEMSPDDHLRWFLLGTLCLAADDDEDYRRICREMVKRFGDTSDPIVAERTAKLSMLKADAGLDAGVLAKLAERAIAGTENHGEYYWFALVKGLAEYRAGHYAQAVDWVGRHAHSPTGPHHDGLAFAIVAMSQHRLGRAQEARVALTSARSVLARMPDPAKGQPFLGDWPGWVQCQELCREAEELAKEK